MLSGVADGNVIVFGAGKTGQKICQELLDCGIKISSFIDNNESLIGKLVCGIEVCATSVVSKMDKSKLFICCAVADSDAYFGIRHQLESMELAEGEHFADFGIDSDVRFYSNWYDFMDIPVETYDIRYKYLKMVISRFKQGVNTPLIYPDTVVLPVIDFKVCTACTFACEHCTLGTALIKKHSFFSPERIVADFDRLMASCYTPLVLIVGGESLLHPQIGEIIERLTKMENLSHIGRFCLITNATILPNADMLKAYKQLPAAEIVINDYGKPNQKIVELTDLCKACEVKCLHNFEHKKAWGDIGSLEYRGYTEDQLRHLFYVCLCTPALYDGEFYSCCRAASLCENGMYPKNESDKINIRGFSGNSEELKQALYDYLYNKPYLNACEYCGGLNSASPQVPVGR